MRTPNLMNGLGNVQEAGGREGGAPKKSGQPDGVIAILIIILSYRLGCIIYWAKITQVFLQPLL